MKEQHFSRQLRSGHIQAAKDSPLFRERLLPDIRAGYVFPAVRPNRLCFYYSGCLLFEHLTFGGHFDYRTNRSYGLVLNKGATPPYVREQDVAHARLIHQFVDAYQGIKLNAGESEGPERAGVGRICRNASYAKDNRGRHVVLDIEVAFESEEDSACDRIDFVVLDTQTGLLTFFEAKRQKNPELKGNPPAVIGQIAAYERFLRGNAQRVIEEYARSVRLTNALFDDDVPEPKDIQTAVKLLVFEYRRNQEKELGSQIRQLRPNLVCIGNPSSVTQKTLVKWLR